MIKKRYARRLESNRIFKPAGIPSTDIEVTTINIDELEAIRLIDYEGKSQIEAAKEMEVSRGTIQRLVEKARKKMIETILTNQGLKISNDISNIKLKGENKLDIAEKEILKVAFPTKDKVTITKNFEELVEFMIYTINETDIIAVTYLPIYVGMDYNLPIVLSEHDVDIVFTSNMNKKMIKHMDHAGIDVILGGRGRIDVSLNEYMSGFLSSRDIVCEPDIKKDNN